MDHMRSLYKENNTLQNMVPQKTIKDFIITV